MLCNLLLFDGVHILINTYMGWFLRAVVLLLLDLDKAASCSDG